MHDEMFRQLGDGVQFALDLDLGLKPGDEVLINPFTKRGTGEDEAQCKVITHPDLHYRPDATAFEVERVIAPMRTGLARWPMECVIARIERDGTQSAVGRQNSDSQ